MARQQLNDLAAFAAVARTRSFTAAAAETGVSPSAISHALRGLEERLGVRLLARSTRSVAPTAAGEALLQHLGPALSQIDEGLAELSHWRDEPEGVVRVTTFHWIASTLLADRLPEFLESHPGITVEVTVDDGFQDIVAGGFDAGIRFGDDVEKDMIGISIGPSLRMVVVATPGYWATHGTPQYPEELRKHRCIGYHSLTSGTLMPWDFEKDGKALRLRVDGPLVCNSADLALSVVRSGGGVGLHMEQDVAEDIRAGRLQPVFDDWCQPFPGAILYHPSRRQVLPALRALIDYLKDHNRLTR